MAAKVRRLRTIVEADTDDAGVRVPPRTSSAAPQPGGSPLPPGSRCSPTGPVRLGPPAPGWHFNGVTLWTQLEGDNDENQVTFPAAQPGRYVMPPYSPLTAGKLKALYERGAGPRNALRSMAILRDARSTYLGYDHMSAGHADVAEGENPHGRATAS